MSLFIELKKRNVFRVGLAYLVSSWVIAQVAGLVLDSIKAPDWVMQALLLMLGLGFIVALIIAWAYELTPEGIKKEKDVVRDDSVVNITSKKLNYITLFAAIAVLVMFVYQQMHPVLVNQANKPNTVIKDAKNSTHPENLTNDNLIQKQVTSEDSVQSIAVLPFVDMSQAGDQEYFADGISEEILNVLVRIPKLKVAGRTSSFSFKGKDQDLRTIGKSLSVNHILEGSIRRSKTKLRITVQLIRSDDGFHLWSETYDREMADIFDIQDEIAKKVAEELTISLGLNTRINKHQRTDDLLVYENYLKAKQLYLLRGRKNLEEALKLLDEVTKRDPDFAPAWTSIALIYGVYSSYTTYEEQVANYKQWNIQGKNAAQQALTLDPDSSEAHAALGRIVFSESDYIESFKQSDRALELSPNNPVILDLISQNSLEVGYFQEAQQLSIKAIAIDPLVAMYRITLGRIYKKLGDNEKAIANLEKGIELDPSLPVSYNYLLDIYTNPDDFDKILPLLNRGIKNGAIPADTLEKHPEFLVFNANKSLWTDKQAVKKLLRITKNSWTKYVCISILKDTEALLDSLENSSWNKPYRTELNLFYENYPGLYANKHWKEQIRKDGLLALWQSRGFPAQCNAIGEDDFQCE
jgi:TolB-like protein